MTDDTHRPVGGGLHRLLDAAFAGVEMTPDAQDLKEEIRANLLARVAELEAAGRSPADAAQHAIDELGDVRALLDPPGTSAPASPSGWDDATQRYRVRPKPRFVVGIVVAALAVAIGLTLAILGASDALPLPIGVTIALLGIAASGVGWIVGDSLAQETTTNHPMPSSRAGGYALASFLAVYGLGFGGLVAVGALPGWAIVFAILGAVAAIILFSFLGATQTNRHKAWVRALQRTQRQPRNRFEEEPETAARFGIYTAVLWTVTAAVYIVISFTVGWTWSWVVFLGGFAAFMIMLARMLFGPSR
ncbi:MFS family permease [Allocatelliglobosispora scoriae]|uniref:MFS family permease n=1 Tax=Allocatelliglobosispora scoriae TaxID=643052 RepID=A0A841BLD4_9ACTN|nr:permease prefix domain 1-containing protein [Allocatelliglobosispora scoriae]MBB5867793.1 MFS family permease [Allocatelliglobosispora scoriae]